MNCPFLLLFGGTVSFSPLILVAKKQSFDDKKITLNADKNHPRENVNLVLAIYWLCIIHTILCYWNWNVGYLLHDKPSVVQQQHQRYSF